jgi:hypothetical protein
LILITFFLTKNSTKSRETKRRKYLKILVACEESQAVTIELRKLGHEAYSCDIEPCSGGRPEWHLQQDVIPLLKEKWDMIIAFPPCTYLTNAGTRHFSRRINSEEKVLAREKLREEAFKFFMLFANADCEKIAIENPVGYANKMFRKPDQIIHPYYFGDNAKKRTCLWLKGLPKLEPTNMLPEPEPEYICQGELSKGKKIGWCEGIKGTTGGQKGRAKARSKTFPGIARAMAEQWGNIK